MNPYLGLWLLLTLVIGGCSANKTLRPQQASGAKLATGEAINLFIRADGQIEGWGDEFRAEDIPQTKAAAVDCEDHCYLLTEAGAVITWGKPLQIPDILSQNVVAISLARPNSLALLASGAVMEWQNDSKRILDVPQSAHAGVVAVSAGGNQLALTEAGTVVAWQRDAKAPEVTLAKELNHDIIAIASGANFGLALTNRGQVLSWGYSLESQAVLTPIPAAAQRKIVAIAVKNDVAQALTDEGSLIEWHNSLPTPKITQNNTLALGVGTGNPAVVLQNQRVAVWGNNYRQSLEVPESLMPTSPALGLSPAPISFPLKRPQPTAPITRPLTSYLDQCLVINNQNQLLFAGSTSAYQQPVPAEAKHAVTAVQTTLFSGAVIKTDGSLVAWGKLTKYLPKTLPTPWQSGLVDLALSDWQLLGVWSDGSLRSLGYYPTSLIPEAAQQQVVAVKTLSDAQMTMVLKRDGSVIIWERDGKLVAIPSQVTDIVAIALGYYDNFLALKADGTAINWNHQGQVYPVPAQASQLVAIDSYESLNLGLTASGRVIAWNKDNNHAFVPLGADRDITAIAANNGLNLAQKADGRLITWGNRDCQSEQDNIPFYH